LVTAQIDRPAAQTNSQPTVREATKGPLELSEQDKAAVIKAALDAKSHQKTPKDFTPTVGASVPRSVFLHGFKPDVVGKVPALKEYWYAYTDAEIALVMRCRQQLLRSSRFRHRLVSTGHGDHGTAEPAKAKGKDGVGNAGSVPAYTSSETIR
jgi:hypothetical protein